jgi:hypothetical protein
LLNSAVNAENIKLKLTLTRLSLPALASVHLGSKLNFPY